MSSLSIADRHNLEKHFGMSGGYVLNFGSHIWRVHWRGWTRYSDANTQRRNVESQQAPHILEGRIRLHAGKLILALVDYDATLNVTPDAEAKARTEMSPDCNSAFRGGPSLSPLKEHAKVLNANHSRADSAIEASVESDPSLAIGTAKELIETCCKTILAERGKPVTGTPDVSTLTKETLKELKLVPEGIPEAARGADVIKRLLSNLGTIGNGLAELRGLYGTGHGKDGSSKGLNARHAKLAVGAASTLAVFLFETHKETK